MTCKHYLFELTKDCRHYVDAKHLNNCVLCVAEKEGPLTQEKTSKYMGLTKMRISQLERQALKKLQNKLKTVREDFFN